MPLAYPDPAANPYSLAFFRTLARWRGGILELIVIELAIVLALSTAIVSVNVYVIPDNNTGAWEAYKSPSGQRPGPLSPHQHSLSCALVRVYARGRRRPARALCCCADAPCATRKNT